MEIFKYIATGICGICAIRYLFKIAKEQRWVGSEATKLFQSKPKLFQVCVCLHQGECCLIAPSAIQNQTWLDQVDITLSEVLLPDLSDIILGYLQNYICIWIGKSVYLKEYWRGFRLQTIVVQGNKTWIQLSQGVKAPNIGKPGNNNYEEMEGTYSIDDPRIDYDAYITLGFGAVGAFDLPGMLHQ